MKFIVNLIKVIAVVIIVIFILDFLISNDSTPDVNTIIANKEIAKKNNTSVWSVKSFINDFEENTGQKYLTTKVNGNYSSSYISQKDVIVKLLVTENDIGILTYLFNENSPFEQSIGRSILKMKNSRGQILDCIITDEWNLKGGMRISGYDCIEFQNFLKRSVGDIKLVIKNEYSPTYKFVVNANGFTKGFNKIK